MTLANATPVAQGAPPNWRSRLVPVLPENEGELEVLSLKMPRKLRERIDAAAKTAGLNRTQTMLSLMRWALEQFDLQRAEEKAAKKR
jgi:hypothetical protein